MRRLGSHKNIPVSGTKLTLGLQVGFICSRLTADKLFPVNPRVTTGPPKMSPLLEAKSLPALIFKPKLIIVPRIIGAWMTLIGTKRPTSSNKCLFKTSTGETKCYTMAAPTLYHKLYSISINFMFKENFPTNKF